jgi:hypothetical protein
MNLMASIGKPPKPIIETLTSRKNINKSLASTKLLLSPTDKTKHLHQLYHVTLSFAIYEKTDAPMSAFIPSERLSKP